MRWAATRSHLSSSWTWVAEQAPGHWHRACSHNVRVWLPWCGVVSCNRVRSCDQIWPWPEMCTVLTCAHNVRVRRATVRHRWRRLYCRVSGRRRRSRGVDVCTKHVAGTSGSCCRVCLDRQHLLSSLLLQCWRVPSVPGGTAMRGWVRPRGTVPSWVLQWQSGVQLHSVRKQRVLPRGIKRVAAVPGWVLQAWGQPSVQLHSVHDRRVLPRWNRCETAVRGWVLQEPCGVQLHSVLKWPVLPRGIKCGTALPGRLLLPGPVRHCTVPGRGILLPSRVDRFPAVQGVCNVCRLAVHNHARCGLRPCQRCK